MIFFPKINIAIQQLFVVILLWLFAGLITGVLFLLRGAELTAPFPVKDLTKFIDWEQLGVFAASAVCLFAFFKWFGHRGKTDDLRRSDQYADLALDEIGSVLYHFGALLIVCAIVGAAKWYLPLGLLFWYVGYRFKPLAQPVPAGEKS